MDKADQNTPVSCLTHRKIQKQHLLIRAVGFTIILSGIMDDKNPGAYLIPFLDKVHKDIMEKNISAIDIDIRDLAYINSSGIKDIINWFLKIESQDNGPKYSITFLCSRESRWQGLSIAMIQKIIPGRIYREYV